MKIKNKISDVVVDLRNNKAIDFSKKQYMRIESCLNAFIDMGFCRKIDNLLDQYVEFQSVIFHIESNKYQFIKKMIDDIPGMRIYMTLHSIMDINYTLDNDWLKNLMYSYLMPNKKDIKEMFDKSYVPEDILKKLERFDPEPVPYSLDPIRIEYSYWKKKEDPIGTEPINVIDIDFGGEKRFNVEKFLKGIKEVDCTYNGEYVDSDVVPF